MSCANVIKKQIVEVNGKKRQKTCVKVPRRQIAFVNVTKDRKYELTHQKRSNNNAAKTQTACVIAVKRQLASSILKVESTGNSLPVSLLFKKKKHSSLCSTYLKGTSFLGYKSV